MAQVLRRLASILKVIPLTVCNLVTQCAHTRSIFQIMEVHLGTSKLSKVSRGPT